MKHLRLLQLLHLKYGFKFLSVSSKPEEIQNTLNGKGRLGAFVVRIITIAVVLSTLTFSLSTVDSISMHFGWIFQSVESFAVILFTVEIYIEDIYIS